MYWWVCVCQCVYVCKGKIEGNNLDLQGGTHPPLPGRQGIPQQNKTLNGKRLPIDSIIHLSARYFRGKSSFEVVEAQMALPQ